MNTFLPGQAGVQIYCFAEVFAQAAQLKGQHITVQGRLHLAIECQEIIAAETQDFAAPAGFSTAISLDIHHGKKMLHWILSGRLCHASGVLQVASPASWPGLGHMGGYYLELQVKRGDKLRYLD